MRRQPWRWGPEAHLVGHTARRPEASKDSPSQVIGGRILTAIGDGRGIGNKFPQTKPMGETPRAAAERPSSGVRRSALLVVAGRPGQEAASWDQSPRPSAGRPRKVSQ